MGLGFEDVKTINPRVIMARISGWGQTGPYAHNRGLPLWARAWVGCGM